MGMRGNRREAVETFLSSFQGSAPVGKALLHHGDITEGRTESGGLDAKGALLSSMKPILPVVVEEEEVSLLQNLRTEDCFGPGTSSQ